MDGYISNIQNPDELMRILKKIQQSKKHKCDCKNLWAKLRVCMGVLTGRFTKKSVMSFGHFIYNGCQEPRYAALITGVMAAAYEDYGQEAWGSEAYEAIKKVSEHKVVGREGQDMMEKIFNSRNPSSKIKTDHRSGFDVISGGRDD